MYPTAEVRWFLQGNIPHQVLKAYLKEGQRPISQPSRIDHYLRLTERSDLGIKIRQGALEIKQRTHSYGIRQFNSQSTGYVANWLKWRFELHPSSQILTNDIAPSPQWTAIRKKRWLRRFSYQNTGDFFEIPGELEITKGCEWELSEVQIVGSLDIWWSIAFESFGESNNLQNELTKVVEKIFIGIGKMEYLPQDSKSYPEWINLVIN